MAKIPICSNGEAFLAATEVLRQVFAGMSQDRIDSFKQYIYAEADEADVSSASVAFGIIIDAAEELAAIEDHYLSNQSLMN